MSRLRLPGRLAAAPRLCASLAMLCVALSACSAITPYTLPIQQGVVLEQSMLSRLKPGMTRNQVGLTLGTPLLTDPYHADRWDYVYYTRIRGDVGEWRRLYLTFKEDRLATIEGDVTTASTVPAVPTAAAPGTGPEPSPGIPVPAPDGSKP